MATDDNPPTSRILFMPRSHPVRHFDDRDRSIPRARAMRPVRQHPHPNARTRAPPPAPPLTRRRRAAEPNAVVLRPPPTPPGSAAYQRVPTPAPRRLHRQEREASPTPNSTAGSDSFHSASSHLDAADVDAAVLHIDSDTDGEPPSAPDKAAVFDARAMRTWEAGRRPAWAPARDADGDGDAQAEARALKDTVMARAHLWVSQQADTPSTPPPPPRQQPTAAVRRMAALWEARQDLPLPLPAPSSPPSPQARSPLHTRPNVWDHNEPPVATATAAVATAVSWGDVEEASISWVDDESPPPPPLVSVTPPPVVPPTPPRIPQPQSKARPNSWESWGAVDDADADVDVDAAIPWVKRTTPPRIRALVSPAPALAPPPARHTLFVGDERSQPTLRLHAPLYEEQTSAPIHGLPRSAPMPTTRRTRGGGGSLPKGRRARGRRARTDVHTVVAADGISMFHDDFVDFQTRPPRRRRRPAALRILSNLSAASGGVADEWDGEYMREHEHEREQDAGDLEAQTPFPSGVPTYAQAHAQRRGWRAALRRARLLSRLG